MDGYFHKSGSPTITVALSGMMSMTPFPVEAVIDTGFTGFVSLPMMKAFPLGLVLMGSADYTMADGSIEPTLLALGWVKLGDEKYKGVFSLSKGNEVLLGMEFLKITQRQLIISAHHGIVRLTV